MQYQTLKISYQGPVQKIQLYRPEVNNSINSQLIQELLSALQAAEAEEVVKILTLEGLPDVFCTGIDLQEVARGQEQVETTTLYPVYYNILKTISQSSKVIISVVRGKVQAEGVGLVAASDFVLADETATFVLSELLFGLLPTCVLPFLIRRIGFQKAYRLALSTQDILADDAHSWGLVDEYGSNLNQLLSRYIRRLKYLPSSGVKDLKNYVNQLWIIRQETEDLAINTGARLAEDPETQEKIRRFVQEGLFPWQA